MQHQYYATSIKSYNVNSFILKQKIIKQQKNYIETFNPFMLIYLKKYKNRTILETMIHFFSFGPNAESEPFVFNTERRLLRFLQGR